jgi:hypothetical protein
MGNSFAQDVIDDTLGETVWRPALIIIDIIEHIAAMANVEIDTGRTSFMWVGDSSLTVL